MAQVHSHYKLKRKVTNRKNQKFLPRTVLLIITKQYMPDYSKCCVYKLCCKDQEIEQFYIGSTTNPTQRKCDHKKCCTKVNDKEYNTYKYQFIRDHGGRNNWDLIVIEEFSCNS